MSQFTFTAEEDALVVQALGVLADVQRASQGRPADDVVALLINIARQQTPNVPVEEAAPVVEAKPAKGKKAKAEEAPAEEVVAEEAPAAE